MKPLTRLFDRNLCHSALISGLVQSSSSFTARARYSKSVSIINSSNWFTSQNLLRKLQYSSNICSFAYWRLNNPTMIGSLCWICALASSISDNQLFTWPSFLNSLLLLAACVFLSLKYFYSVLAAVYSLVSIGANGQELHGLCDYTGVGIFVTFPFCIHCCLYKAVETFFWSLLNKTVNFCNKQPQLQISKG